VEDARILSSIYQKNPEYWVDFMMNHKLELPDVRNTNPFFTGLATFLAFLVFGAIPLLPFFMVTGTPDVGTVFRFSIAGTFLALIALGMLKRLIVGGQTKHALLEVILVGGIAATLAYLVGTFFAH